MLFTLVGVAGEDDLDAPDMPHREHSGPDGPAPRGAATAAHAPPKRDEKSSASLQERLLKEITQTIGEEALAVRAKRRLPLKNGLTQDDAGAVEVAYLAKVNGAPETPLPSPAPEAPATPLPSLAPPSTRSKAHLTLSPLNSA